MTAVRSVSVAGGMRLSRLLSVVRQSVVRPCLSVPRGASVRRGRLDCDIIPLFKEA